MCFKRFFLFLIIFIYYFDASLAGASIPTWRILWIIIPRVNVTHTDSVTYNFTLTQDEIIKIREMSERVEQFIEESTNHAVDIEMTVVESKGTVRSLTDDGTFLFVGEDDFPSDIKRELEYAENEDRPYHIKVATCRLDGDSEKLHNWYGLGGGTYARVHFYNNTKSSDFAVTETAPHPEEVWIHELIHCFESIFGNLGTMAGLHDNAKYGYEHHNGWYRWYHDILAGQVEDPTTGEYVGIKSNMWQHLPFGRVAYWKGHSYKILDKVRSWSGAKSYCESLGGHLVTITSEEEQNVVATLLKHAATWNYFGYWMGAQKDTQKDTKWHWVTGEAFKYAKFSEGQPDGSGDYLQMYNYPDQSNWDDTTTNANVEIQGNFYPHGMICEWEYTETPPITILTANHLPGGIVNTSYSFQLKADEGTAATTTTPTSSTPTWTYVSGILPNGLSLTPTGLLTGNPTSTGSFDFTVKVEINAGNSAYNLKTFTLEVTSDCVAPVIATVDLKDAIIADEYHRMLEAKGSAATWSIVDKYLPANLILSQNGEITGKALAEGTYEFTVRAANSAGHNDKTFSLKVIDASFPETEMESDEDEQNNDEENKNGKDNEDGYSNDGEQDNLENKEKQGGQEHQENNNETNEKDDEQSGNTQPDSPQNRPEVNNPQEHNNDSSGGGGCNSGMFNFFLLYLVIRKYARNCSRAEKCFIASLI